MFDKLGERDTGAFVQLAIKGEQTTLLPVDFRVLAPAKTKEAEIRQYVEQYKLAGKYFDIKQY
ncbi:MAG: hypothetical protein ACK5JS_02500 [Mangrovibacterium sp.]